MLDFRLPPGSSSGSLRAYFFFLWRCALTRAMASSFLGFLDHTQRRNTVARIPLDEWSARRRDLYLTTHNTHNRQTSIPSAGFEPTISAGELSQTYALDRPAIGTGITLSNIPEERRSHKNTRLLSSGVWCRVVWYTCTEVQEELAASIFGVHFKQTTWRCIPDDRNRHGHHRKKFNYRTHSHKEHM